MTLNGTNLISTWYQKFSQSYNYFILHFSFVYMFFINHKMKSVENNKATQNKPSNVQMSLISNKTANMKIKYFLYPEKSKHKFMKTSYDFSSMYTRRDWKIRLFRPAVSCELNRQNFKNMNYSFLSYFTKVQS